MKYSYRLIGWAVVIAMASTFSGVFATDFPGPDADFYAGFQIPYEFVNPWILIDECAGGCDDNVWARPIGFNFNYRGTSYSTVYVSVNGYISFTNSGHDYNNTTIPNAGGPPNMIAALWDDLMIYPSDGGMWEDLWGTAPNREYVIQWWDISERQNEASNLRFTIILHESSGAIELLYDDLTQTPMDVTVGIEDSTQTKGILGYYEGTSYGTFGGLPATYSSYQFQPAPNLTSYAPPGWYGPVVPRNTSDTTISYAPLPSILYGWGIGGNTWHNWLGHESRGYPVPVMGELQFSIDNSPRILNSFPPQSAGNFIYGTFSYPLDVAGGRHTLTIVQDPTNAIPESDETDNTYMEQFIWSPFSLSDGVTHYCPSEAAYGFGPTGILNVDGFQFFCDYYWMAVGVRSTPVDLDLNLYNDYVDSLNGFSTILDTSQFYPEIDFIAIDGNRVGPLSHQAGIYDCAQAGGSEYYQVQYDTPDTTWYYSGVEDLLFGPFSFTGDDVLKCHEINWTATEVGWITCINGTSGDLDVRFLGSQVGDPYKGRADYLGNFYDNGPGLDDQCEVPMIPASYYGLVVTNESGVSGDYYIRISPDRYTPTPTATQPATYTPTRTPTATPTLHPTTTPTMTPTNTPTRTPTSTMTPTGTQPSTATPTRTPTGTATPTRTPTGSPTNECINNGDTNLSGDVTAGDAQLAFLITLGLYSPTYLEECAADCNGNGEVTAGDAQAIFLKALGLGTCVDPL